MKDQTNRRSIGKTALALLAGGAAMILPGAAQATDGYFLNGIGAKSKGMGGVAIALPQDALSIASNPAAATEVGHRMDIGVDVFIPKRGASIEGNAFGLDGDYSGNDANPFLLPEVGYVRPLSDRVSVGIAIYGNGGMNTTYGKANPFGALGAQGTAGVDLKQGFITPTVAVKVTPDHSLGVSPVVVVQSFKARGIQPFAGAAADPANFTNRGTSWSAGGGVRVGYYGKLSDQISIGATYQTMLWTGKFQKYAGLFADSGSFDVPSQYGAGITFRPNKRLTLSADIKQIEYSDVESVGNPVQILFTGVPFGADEGPGFGWNDVTVVKFGAAYAASDAWTVRAGYGRNDNPVPQSQTLLNVLAPGIVQDHFTAGATWTSRSGLEVTGYVMHAPKNEVFGQASIPPNFGGGEANVRLSETSFGLAAGISF